MIKITMNQLMRDGYTVQLDLEDNDFNLVISWPEITPNIYLGDSDHEAR